MKISKINHTKSAVIKKSINQPEKYGKSEKTVAGTLYKDPKSFMDMDKHLKYANSSARRLFNVFNSVKNETDRNKPYKDFISGNYGNSLINGIFFCDKSVTVKNGKEKKIKELDSFENVIRKIRNEKVPAVKEIEIYSETIDLYTRKDLRDQKENLKIFYECITDRSKIESSKDRLKRLYDGIGECFTQKRKLSNIKTSIEHQNMLVQPRNDIIGLSGLKPVEKENGTKNRNAEEKEGLNSFISLYADLNRENRLFCLKKIARIVEIFFMDCSDFRQIQDERSRNVLFGDFNLKEAIACWKEDRTYLIDVDRYANEAEKIKNKCRDNESLQAKEVRLCNARIREDIKKKTAELYRNAVKLDRGKLCLFEDDRTNLFWIHHIENATERILKKADVNSLYKLQYCYLKDKIRKDITGYISTKYIGIGKAVYQFGMDFSEKEGKIRLGNIAKRYRDGITSFDYEMIKAEETLQREVSVAVAFAANNLARAVVNIPEAVKDEENNTDFLLWKKDKIGKYLLNSSEDGTVRNVLQYFGGDSVRGDIKEIIRKAYPDSENRGTDFVNDLKSYIYALRNESMHFSTLKTNMEIRGRELGDIFEADALYCSRREIEKFCSTGLTLFYDGEKIKAMLEKIYEKQVGRASQVPSYNTVFPRKQFASWLAEDLGLNPDFKDAGDENSREKWQSALYYAFKEIYYNAFLADEKKTKEYFSSALDNECGKADRYTGEGRATADFKERYDELTVTRDKNSGKEEEKEISFPEICQMFMTEYSLQNNSRKKKSAEEKSRDPEIYRHYIVILSKMIRVSFGRFIEENSFFRFLIDDAKDRKFTEDIRKENIRPENFLPDLRLETYSRLTEKVKNSPELMKWYITARFLDGKTLNELLGSLRSYVQYADDVIRRSKECGCPVSNPDQFKTKIRQIAEVLDMCVRVCSVYSNNTGDYFEDYSAFLKNYMDEKCTGNSLYHDEKNPIANRNIIAAKLFGPAEVLKEALKDSRITEKDLKKYEGKRKRISSLMSKDILTEAEQKEIVHYQNLKNRVELRNLTDYGKLINDLFGQLINWAYLRERDLLYFQLGFHYTCLNNGTEKPSDGYTKLSTGDVTIYNPILWQIASVNIFGLNILKKENGNWAFIEKNLAKNAKTQKFYAYSKELGFGKEDLFNAGLEVFEVIEEHSSITEVRNAIDHFRYYSDHSSSILDYYSEMFDRFFTYDCRYKKNVVNMLGNILLRYKAVLKGVAFETGTKKKGIEDVKERAQIAVREKGLLSDKGTYSVYKDKASKDKNRLKQIKIDMKDEKYLSDIRKILEYKEKDS